MVSEITGISIVCSTVCSGEHQRKHQNPASLAFVRGFPSLRASNVEIVPFADVIMVYFFFFFAILSKHYLLISGKPGKCGIPQIVELKDGAVALSWTPPEDDGGAPIESYVLEMRPEGQAEWKPVSADVISQPKSTAKGLKQDVPYEFRVAAVNKAGRGPFSDNSKPVVAKAPVGKWYCGFDYLLSDNSSMELMLFVELNRL